MGPDIREQLGWAAGEPRGELDPAALGRRVGQLRRRRIGASVAGAALLVLAVPLGQAGLERLREPAGAVDRPPGPAATTPAPAVTTTTAPTATTATGRAARPAPLGTPEQALRALARLPKGWTALPKPPGPRTEGTSLWVGNGLFFWGGQSWSGGSSHAGGWLFDPVARRWHAIAPAPLAGRSLAAAVWTGDEVLVWGGYGFGGRRFADGAAYDPATDTWRVLPAAPLSARAPVATVWTGTEMVVWGDGNRRPPGVRDGAAFDPRANRWRTIAAAPVALNQAGWPTPSTVWTGREMVVIGSLLDGNNTATTTDATGLAYDPAADTWRTLPPVRLSPQASAAAWTGREVMAMDYERRVALYDPRRNAWRRLPGAPMDFCEGYPDVAANGPVALVRGCAFALWDLEAGRWVKVRNPPRNGQGRIVAAGPVFLIAGATHESSANGLVAYHP